MNQITRTNLSKLKKCNQVWDLMEPNDCGRLCTQCNKTIVDFRKMSAPEIAERHLFSEEAVCGIYRDDQLVGNRALVAKKKRLNMKSAYLAVVGLLFHQVSDAQQSTIKTRQVQVDSVQSPNFWNDLKQGKDHIAKTDSLVFYGTIYDENGLPVPFANVLISGAHEGVSADLVGRFWINLTQALDTASQVFLQFKTIGYMSQTIMVKADSSREINVYFRNAETVAFGVILLPWHKRLWYKITRPFRGWKKSA